MQSPQLRPANSKDLFPLDSSVKTIRVEYQRTLNLITVRGSSVGDQSDYKYDALLDDIESHFKMGNSLQIYFNYDYLDSAALAYLATIIAALNDFHQRGKLVKVHWSCFSVADNVVDEGEKLKSLSKFEFHI